MEIGNGGRQVARGISVGASLGAFSASAQIAIDRPAISLVCEMANAKTDESLVNADLVATTARPIRQTKCDRTVDVAGSPIASERMNPAKRANAGRSDALAGELNA